MNTDLKKVLRAISLELRHTLEGTYDERGDFQPGDLERRLNAIGVWRNRPSKPLAELTHLPDEDKAARQVIDAYLGFRAEAGVGQADAVAEFVREAAYNWANRLLTLRCMEARGIIDEVILQKEVYGRRSLLHNRLGQQNPALLAQADEGLFTVLLTEFAQRARELPALFHPKAPAIALRPSLAALKKCIGLLSGTVKAGSYEATGDELFAAPDALGWAYQYWNAEEKDRVFEKVRTEKGAKIAGADIIPATQLYTEPYMVKFLVQNSLGALWQGMHPDSHLADGWEYYVRDADRAPVEKKPVRDITFLDPACGSGHFHLEAFDLLYAMYEAEASLQSSVSSLQSPEEICAAILNHNLYGIDIDERAIQIAQAALWMKAKELAWELEPEALTDFHHHFVATNIRLPRGKSHLETFLRQHPEDLPLRPALETVFEGLENAHELGSLLQLEEPVEKELRYLQGKQAEAAQTMQQGELFAELEKPRQGALPLGVESYDAWKAKTLSQLQTHFEAEAEAADLTQAFFGQSAGKGLDLFDILSQQYDVIAANPPYMALSKTPSQFRNRLEVLLQHKALDVYEAFLEMYKSRLKPKGFLAYLTLHGWMFLSSFDVLRLGLLENIHFAVLVHLGTGTMKELSNPNALGFCMFTLQNSSSLLSGTYFDCTRNSQKDVAVLEKIKNRTHSRVLKSHFEKLHGSPIAYWIPQPVYTALENCRPISQYADVRQGVITGDNNRFLRFFWETSDRSRWIPYYKGGKYQRFAGNESYCIDWEGNGVRLKNIYTSSGRLKSRPQNIQYFGKLGITWTAQTNYGFSCRLMRIGSGFDAGGPALFPHDDLEHFALLSICNSQWASFTLRALNPTINFREGYVAQIPIPSLDFFENLSLIGRLATDTRLQNCAEIINEILFAPDKFSANSTNVYGFSEGKITSELGRNGLISVLLRIIDDQVFSALSLAKNQEVVDVIIGKSQGLPPHFLPLIAKYDAVPLEVEVELPNTSIKHFGELERQSPLPHEVTSLKENLRSLYEAGPGARAEEIEPSTINNEEDDGEDVGDTSNHETNKVATESFLEDLSVSLQIHPLSVYWLLKEGIEQEGWRCPPEEKRLTEDRFTVAVLRLLGHRWPKQIEANKPVPPWAEPGGIVPITGGILHQRVGQTSLLAHPDKPGGLSNSLEREFADIVGEKLADWLAGSFFTRHISQFKKRPIAWQLQTSPAPGQRRRGEPAFAALLYYHKLSADLLPTLRSQFVRDLSRAYETEQRTLRQSQSRSSDQEARLRQLEIWLTELQTFSNALQQVSDRGFGDTPALQAALRQHALADAMQSLKSVWLGRLADKAASDALPDWQTRADKTCIHPALRDWIAAAIAHLPHHCAQVGAPAPQAAKLTTDPDARILAAIIGSQAKEMVSQSLKLAGDAWFSELDANLLRPLLDDINELKTQLTALEEKRDSLDTQDVRGRYEIEGQIKSFKAQIKKKSAERNAHRKAANELRQHIESWRCPAAAGWTDWLGQQPLFDPFASLDGQRQPPPTIAEFIAQESRYIPDINDGVRVNIAPLQKAGLLAADVLAAKDVDKAIADRADWRADERRWCREGKLPRPGWWHKTS